LILRADRRDDDLVALRELERLPDESVNALKAGIERQHPAGLLMLHAIYVEPRAHCSLKSPNPMPMHPQSSLKNLDARTLRKKD
jgi:hypothetical protein